MKKIFCVIISMVIIALSVASPISALSDNSIHSETSVQTIYMDDGRYIEISISSSHKIHTAHTATDSHKPNYAGDKTVTCKDKNGNVEWEYILSGEFYVVEGVSSVCTNVSYTQNIYKSNWNFSDGSVTKSGNTAHGYGSFKRKVLFITVEEQLIDLEFTCDIYGHLS